MPTRITRWSTNKSWTTPYDMSNINNWYSEQLRAKLAEWNIIANYSKAELKSLYVANLSHRSSPNYHEQQRQEELHVPQTLNHVQMER